MLAHPTSTSWRRCYGLDWIAWMALLLVQLSVALAPPMTAALQWAGKAGVGGKRW